MLSLETATTLMNLCVTDSWEFNKDEQVLKNFPFLKHFNQNAWKLLHISYYQPKDIEMVLYKEINGEE